MQFDENASAAWLASTVNRKLPAAVLEGVDIGATCRRAVNHDLLQSLRVEGHLMYGVTALVAQKTHILASRTGRTRRELERELGNSNNLRENADQEIPTQTQTLDIISSDFSLDRVMDEFRPSQLPQDSDEEHDISIDDELRGEVDDELRRDQADHAAPDLLSEGDEQILRDILGDAPDQPNIPDEISVVEEEVHVSGIDIPMSEDIDEAPTPEVVPEVQPTTRKQPRATRKRRLCPVDQRTTISRPIRAPASTLVEPTVESGDDEVDEFFDLDYILDAVKRRRLADIPSDVPELEADVSVAGISLDGLMDDLNDGQFDEIGGNDAFPEADQPPATQDVVGSILEQENLEELMAREIQSARSTIKSFGSGHFSDIATGTRRSRAALFSEALALATNCEIDLDQEAPYREIELLTL